MFNWYVVFVFRNELIMLIRSIVSLVAAVHCTCSTIRYWKKKKGLWNVARHSFT